MCTAAELNELLTAGDPIDALAGWTHPQAAAVKFAQASGTRFLTVTPVEAPAGVGALVLLNQYRSLFAEDDIEAFTAVLARRAQISAERESLTAIVESSHDAIIGKTLDGVITSWNPSAEQLYGYRLDEVLGQHASLLFPTHKNRPKRS